MPSHPHRAGGDEQRQHRAAAEAELLGAVGQHVDHEDVGDAVGGDEGATRQEHRPPALGEHLEDRDLGDAVLLLDGLEGGALHDAEADPHGGGDQGDAQEEGDAPAPRQELLLAHQLGAQEEDDVGQDDAGRDAHLGRCAVEALLALGRVLGGHEDGAAPLAADADALEEAQGHEQDRGPDADGVVVGQQADADGGRAHEQQRGDQHRLAAGLVTEVAHDHAAEGAGDEADREGGERGEGAGEVGATGEELRAEHEGRGGAVDEEVVPLDRRADEAARDGPPQQLAALGGARVVVDR